MTLMVICASIMRDTWIISGLTITWILTDLKSFPYGENVFMPSINLGIFFLDREPDVTDHCYEIEMDAIGGFPMVLTGRMIAHRNNAEILRAIAEEYWRPTKDWKYYEYIGNEMTIISEVKFDASQRNKSRDEYMMDYNKALYIFR